MTSYLIYIVALGVGFKCPHKIHLNTQCPPPTTSRLSMQCMDGPLIIQYALAIKMHKKIFLTKGLRLMQLVVHKCLLL